MACYGLKQAAVVNAFLFGEDVAVSSFKTHLLLTTLPILHRMKFKVHLILVQLWLTAFKAINNLCETLKKGHNVI